jgi:alkylation response protein AidB-like acyl-CoA dehydrogenase
MDFNLNDEQKQIKALVKDFCEREIDEKQIDDIFDRVYMARTCDEVRAVFPYHLLDRLHELGLRQLGIPQKYGGMAPISDGNLTRAIAAEEMGYRAGSAAVLLATPYMVCSSATCSPLVSEEQKEEFYTVYMNNPRIWLGGTVSDPLGGTDPHLPYDEAGVGLKSIFGYKDGDEWIINGDKMFCSGGAVADLLVTAVRTDKDGPVTQSTTAFLVPTNLPGISQTLNRFTGVEICGNAQTYFDNVRLPESALLGQLNKGYYCMIEGAMMYKWMMLVPFLGEIQRVYDDVADYARQRVQGGKPIIQHSSVAAMLGEAAANIEALRAFTYRTAWETDNWEKAGGSPYVFWSVGYLYLFKKIGLRMSEIANEIYGGVGKSLDMPLDKFARRIFTWQAAGTTTGTNAIQCSNSYNQL